MPAQEPVSGILVVDKPLHLTSFDVVARVRRALHEKRVGHAGTLDPLATGVLVVCVGVATKVVPYLMDTDKLYRATCRLGIATDTDDADEKARVLFRADAAALKAVREADVRAALDKMVGEIIQQPPRFSALKHEGQRLYDLARKGRDSDEDEAPVLPDKARPVRIDAIAVESIELDSEAPSVTFTVRCGKGTYIRSMARDLGAALGVGGHLTALRRLRVGMFDLSSAVAPEPAALSSARRFSFAEALAHLPQAHVPDPLARRLRQGQPSALVELQEEQRSQAALFTVLDSAGDLIAIVEKEAPSGRLRIARGF